MRLEKIRVSLTYKLALRMVLVNSSIILKIKKYIKSYNSVGLNNINKVIRNKNFGLLEVIGKSILGPIPIISFSKKTKIFKINKKIVNFWSIMLKLAKVFNYTKEFVWPIVGFSGNNQTYRENIEYGNLRRLYSSKAPKIIIKFGEQPEIARWPKTYIVWAITSTYWNREVVPRWEYKAFKIKRWLKVWEWDNVILPKRIKRAKMEEIRAKKKIIRDKKRDELKRVKDSVIPKDVAKSRRKKIKYEEFVDFREDFDLNWKNYFFEYMESPKYSGKLSKKYNETIYGSFRRLPVDLTDMYILPKYPRRRYVEEEFSFWERGESDVTEYPSYLNTSEDVDPTWDIRDYYTPYDWEVLKKISEIPPGSKELKYTLEDYMYPFLENKVSSFKKTWKVSKRYQKDFPKLRGVQPKHFITFKPTIAIELLRYKILKQLVNYKKENDEFGTLESGSTKDFLADERIRLWDFEVRNEDYEKEIERLEDIKEWEAERIRLICFIDWWGNYILKPRGVYNRVEKAQILELEDIPYRLSWGNTKPLLKQLITTVNHGYIKYKDKPYSKTPTSSSVGLPLWEYRKLRFKPINTIGENIKQSNVKKTNYVKNILMRLNFIKFFYKSSYGVLFSTKYEYEMAVLRESILILRELILVLAQNELNNWQNVQLGGIRISSSSSGCHNNFFKKLNTKNSPPLRSGRKFKRKVLNIISAILNKYYESLLNIAMVSANGVWVLKYPDNLHSIGKKLMWKKK